MSYNWSPYAVGGATRPDSFTNMQPEFQSSLFAMLQAADQNVGPGLQVYSGYRSPERQAELWEAALAKYGSPEAARKGVAPPGRSKHNTGQAADLKYNGKRLDQLAEDHPVRSWLQTNADQFGLSFPMSWEPWQVEAAGARGTPFVPPAEMTPDALAADTAATAGQGGGSFFGLPVNELTDQQKGLQGLARIAAGMGQTEAPRIQAPQAQPMQMQRRDTISPYMSLFQGLQNGRF